MLTSIYDLQKFAETVCEYAEAFDGGKISVSFSGNDGRPVTTKNGNNYTIKIPRPNNKMTKKDDAIIRAYITREIAHLSEGRGFYKKLAENNLKVSESPLAAIAMDIEEARVEREDINRYKGDRKVLSDGDQYILPSETEAYHRVPHEGEEVEPYHKYMAARIAALESKGDWNNAATDAALEMESAAPPVTKEILKKIRDAGLIDALKNLNSYEDSYELARTLYELLYAQSADEHEQQQKEQGEGGSGDPDGNEEGKPQGDGSNAGEGEGDEDGRAQEVPNESSEGDGGTPNQSYAEKSGTKIEFKGQKPQERGGSGANLEYATRRHSGVYEPLPWSDFRVWDVHRDRVSHTDMRRTTGQTGGYYGAGSARRNLEQHHKENGVPGKGFGNKIRRFLQIKSQSRYVGGAKKGRLHRKNAYRVGVPTVGNGDWNSRVFREKQTSDILDVAVTVLTDFSGSMSGDKLSNAIDSTMLLNSSIARSLHIPMQILTFTEEDSSTFIGIVKGFEDRLADEEINDNMIKCAAFMSGNSDGDAIMWAYENTRHRKEKRKLLIVLSDGSPAGSRFGDLEGYTKDVIRTIEREGVVEIIGLGIMHQGVKHMYKDTAIIQSADELEATLLNIVKNHIVR